MELPPGLVYLAEVLPLTLFPSAVTYAFLSRILPLLDLGVPPLSLWARILVTLFAPPVGIILVHFYKEWQNTRDAAARGATPIPVVYDKWPGGLSLIASVLKSFTAGYPGQSSATQIHKV
jgi:hypothetical protein